MKLGFACLAFNRRGHDILSTRKSREPEGGAFQTTAEALEDNRIAARWLAERGHARPVVIGHSNGGMLGVQFAVDRFETRALVLLSAGRGRSTTVQQGGSAGLLAADRFDEIDAKARKLVAEGRGDALMLVPGWWYVITAASFLDWLGTVPDTIALAPRVRCPVLCIRGDKESAEHYPAEEFKRAATAPCEVVIVADCDHFYNGKEVEVTAIVTAWLTKALGPHVDREPSPR